MNARVELDELIAGWQVETLDEPGLRRLEVLLLADPAARLQFARQCQQDVVLRQVCRITAAGSRPGAETQRLMQLDADPGPTWGQRRGGALSGPQRRPGAKRLRRPRRPRARPGGLGLAIPAIVVLAVLVLAVVLRPSPPAAASLAPIPTDVVVTPATIAIVRELDGPAEHQRAWVLAAAQRDQALVSGDQLRLGTASRAVLALADGTRFTLTGGAGIQVLAADRGFTLALDRGQVEAAVTPQPAARQVVVRTPEGTVRVVGTAFEVHTTTGRTRVSVREGQVEARAHAGEPRLLGARQAAVIEGGRLRLELAEPSANPPLPPVAGPTPVAIGVVAFTLLDTVHDREVVGFDPIPEGVVIDRASLGLEALSLRANVLGPVLAVRFWIDGVETVLEQVVPYTLTGDLELDYKPWRPASGSYLIEAQAFADEQGETPLGARFQQRVQIR